MDKRLTDKETMKLKMHIKNLIKKDDPDWFKAFIIIAQLSNHYRTGYIKRNVHDHLCESISEHIYSMVMILIMNFKLKTEYLNPAILMILIHEIGEVFGGDITPFCGVSVEEKYQIEKRSIVQLFHEIGLDRKTRHKLFYIWHEFEENETPVSKLANMLDRFQFVAQVKLYSRIGFRFGDEIKDNVLTPKGYETIDDYYDDINRVIDEYGMRA